MHKSVRAVLMVLSAMVMTSCGLLGSLAETGGRTLNSVGRTLSGDADVQEKWKDKPAGAQSLDAAGRILPAMAVEYP